MQQLQLPIKLSEERLHHLPYRERLQKLLESDLEFHGRNSKYSTHGWHAFPAKFPPQLPRKFITELTRPGDIVLDPMAGSCTTLIEAVSLERRAIGCDIDPLSLQIGLAKLRSADDARPLEQTKRYTDRIKDARRICYSAFETKRSLSECKNRRIEFN